MGYAFGAIIVVFGITMIIAGAHGTAGELFGAITGTPAPRGAWGGSGSGAGGAASSAADTLLATIPSASTYPYRGHIA